MNRFYLIFVFTFLFLSACQSKKIIKQAKRDIVIEKGFQKKQENNFTILNAEIENNILSLQIETLKNDNMNFYILWNGSIMKSLPPKLTFVLVDNSDNQSNNKKIKMDLEFDLLPLKQKFDSYEKIIINIKGYDKSLIYSINKI